MKDNKISFRPEDQNKHPLILSLVHNVLDEFEKVNKTKETPPFDTHTIQAIRASLRILDGWEEIYLNNAFQKGILLGIDKNHPIGLLDKETYCYVDDFFIATPESNENK